MPCHKLHWAQQQLPPRLHLLRSQLSLQAASAEYHYLQWQHQPPPLLLPLCCLSVCRLCTHQHWATLQHPLLLSGCYCCCPRCATLLVQRHCC
jgi:hypothetical protein